MWRWTTLLLCVLTWSVLAQATRPAGGSADEVLGRLLQPPRPVPLQPVPDSPRTDTASARTVAPGGEQLNLIREGTYLVDRVGRLTRTADGRYELTLEADGQAMQDPPLLILPNLKLEGMEKQIQGTGRDLRFRVTGLITEYNGRNHILLDKFVVVPDQIPPAPRAGGGR
jgi:hypothetical protein